MRVTALLLALAASLPAAEPAPPPYVVRLLAIGHEPERKYKLRSDGFYDMLELDPREMPPQALFLRLPALPVALPGPKRVARIRCGVQLNAVQETALPATVPPEAPLPIELEVVKPGADGAKGPAERTYDEIGEIKRAADSTSALVILYNPVGRKSWDAVKPFVIDTSERALPPGTILLYNLCPESLVAQVGSPNAGTLAPAQSAFVRPSVSASGQFGLKLVLMRNREEVQLVDSQRDLPPGSRGLLVVYPVPGNRNARAADFVLYIFPPDPKPETVAAPVPGPAGAKAAVR